jgi:hypothetical protein
MATVYVCDNARESMLVSYVSEPILAFGAMKQWNERGLCPLLRRIRAVLIRGIVNKGTLGEISAMVLLLKTTDLLDAGLGWSEVILILSRNCLWWNLISRRRRRSARRMISRKIYLWYDTRKQQTQFQPFHPVV